MFGLLLESNVDKKYSDLLSSVLECFCQKNVLTQWGVKLTTFGSRHKHSTTELRSEYFFVKIKMLNRPISFPRSKQKILPSERPELRMGHMCKLYFLATLSVIETHGHLPFDGMMLQIRSQTRSILI